jgi:hypothetical protein
MAYTMGQAARATGVSKPRLSRAIKAGKISAERHDDGSYTIDPAELHRVYPATVATTSAMERGDTPDNPIDTPVAIPWEALAIERAETIADLRRRLDAAEARLDRFLLTDQRRTRSWWPWRVRA